jgi:hypothetical protein
LDLRESLEPGSIFRRVAKAVAAASVVTACGGGGGSAGAEPGTLRLALTDAPACGLERVFITIAAIRVHASSTAEDSDAGWTDLPLGPVHRIDLLTLTNGRLQELGATALPAGRYEQVRVILADNVAASSSIANAVLPAGGSRELPLASPHGGPTTIRIRAQLQVATGATADFVLDLDPCRSVARAGDAGYQLRPVVTIVPRLSSGIDGTVAPSLANATTTVSAQRDGGVVRSARPDAQGRFRIPFLEPGTYTLVIRADGRATGVVTGVTVGTDMTTVSSIASAIELPPSPVGEITGSVSVEEDTGTAAAPSTAFTDALVRARQQLASGESIEVQSRPVDGLLGTYRLQVPKAPLFRAAYGPPGPLSFTPDTTDEGRYSVEVLVSDDAPHVDR